MMATWLQSRSTISSTWVVRKMVAPRLIMRCSMAFSMPGGDGVHAFERLVEKQHLGPVNHGGGERQLLLHAVREVGHQLARLVGELHEIEQLVGALIGGLAVETVHPADEAQILGRGEAAEQSHALRHHADLTLQVERTGT